MNRIKIIVIDILERSKVDQLIIIAQGTNYIYRGLPKNCPSYLCNEKVIELKPIQDQFDFYLRITIE